MNPRAVRVAAGALTIGLAACFLPGSAGSLLAQEESAAEADFSRWNIELAEERPAEGFAEGVELFRKGDFRRAEGSFKKLTRAVETPADTAKLQAWMVACKGGYELARYERQAGGGRVQAALFAALDASQRYTGTPIATAFDAFTSKLAEKALVVVEDFEFPSPAYTEKYGKTWVDNEKVVYRGKGCMQWQQTRDRAGFQLRIAKVPGNWNSYEGLVFWVLAEVPTEVEVIVACQGQEKEQRNAFMAKHKPRRSTDWQRVYFDLSKLKKYGGADYGAVESVLLQTNPSANFKFLVDYVCLVKK